MDPGALRDVARAKDVQFLDLREALAGKVACAGGTELATPQAMALAPLG